MPRDPELDIAVQRYQQRTQPGGAPLIVTVLVVLLHLGLVYVTVMVVGLSAMGTDSCGYVECGDPQWANRALALAFYGSAVLVVLNIGVTAWRAIIARPTLLVVATGCLLQVALAAVSFYLMTLAGPAS